MIPARKFLHRHPAFKDLIRIAGSQNGREISPYLVEKDYWIMHCLYGLQRAGYTFQIKGGTSLSKGFKLIDRFSEDIDIQIEPPEGSAVKKGKNQNKKSHVESRKRYFDDLAKEIRIEDVDSQRDYEFDDEKCRNGGIRLRYEARFKPDTATVKEGVLLELGFWEFRPVEPRNFSSWAYDLAQSRVADVIDNRAIDISCYAPGYTFVEKLQTISTKYRKYKDGGEIHPNFMRNYYDVYRLLQSEEVRSFAKSKEFEKHLKEHFPERDREIPLWQNPAFLLGDTDDYNAFEKRYSSESGL